MPPALSQLRDLYTKREWRAGVLLFAGCFVMRALAAAYVPQDSFLYPSSAVALAGLFFAGLRLWPAAFLALLLGSALGQVPFPFVYLLPIAQTLQAVAGAHLLRKANIDPLFRRYRDTFYVILTILLVSVVTPTFFFLTGMPNALSWRNEYVATVFVLLVLAPFLLRWIAKPRFKRPIGEILETLAVFILLVGIEVAVFMYGIIEVSGVFVIYFLLIPFFWIAIRLRPRFVTLAVVVTSGFALQSVMTTSAPNDLVNNLSSMELFLIVLATTFYVIVSLEEDRRAHTNLVRSQLATLENAVSRISSESQAKNDFIAILAHELRNPLAPVVSGIELMKVKGPRDADEGDTLAVMESSMGTVRRLLDDLLDISRISEGKIALKRKVVGIGPVLGKAIISTAHHFKERHQSFDTTGLDQNLYVEGDEVRLEQVFSNLLTNASKYSDSGKAISLDVSATNGMVEVTVTDEGVGIPEDELGTVFLPFHQLEQGRRSKRGLGIGLALVHSFVQMHGGTIEARSRGVGKGSIFVVRLPLANSGPDGSNSRRPRAARLKKRSGPRVLVVDDNDAAAIGIGRLLELQGATVSYAYNADQALTQAQGRPLPDAILLDIGLPDKDGYTVAKTLRTQGYTGLLVALSGFSTQDAKDRGKAAGFDHYLVKPIGLAELRSVLPGV